MASSLYRALPRNQKTSKSPVKIHIVRQGEEDEICLLPIRDLPGVLTDTDQMEEGKELPGRIHYISEHPQCRRKSIERMAKLRIRGSDSP